MTSRSRAVVDGSADAAGWLLVAALCLAPWAFGSRPYWAALSLAGVLFSACALRTAVWLLRRRLPAVPPVCWGAVIFLTAFAAVSILNPQSTFDAARGSFLPNSAYVPSLPSTVDVRAGWTFTLEMIAYLAVIPVAADLSRSAHWRKRLLGAMALTGVLVAVAGLCLKAGCLPRLREDLQGRPWAQGVIFGPFDYHGNAGAFLNLALPAAAWNAATAHPARRLWWRCAVGVLYVALFVNSSRAALAIGLFLSPICLYLTLRAGGASQPPPRRDYRRWLGGAGIAAVALLAIGFLLANDRAQPLPRLQHLSSELREPEYPRYLQSRAAWEMAGERPLFGAGIGSYKLLVQTSSIRGYYFAPAFRPGEPFTVLGHTHEDYLQTLAEWGWVGFGGWAVLVGGAFVMLGRLLRRTGFGSRTGLALGAALLGVYLHALGDCPLQLPTLQFYVALCLGLAWGSANWQNDPDPRFTLR